jgi:hypothetical protein
VGGPRTRGGSAGHTPVCVMPIAKRIYWIRFLRGERVQIKCWFPVHLRRSESLWRRWGLLAQQIEVESGEAQPCS